MAFQCLDCKQLIGATRGGMTLWPTRPIMMLRLLSPQESSPNRLVRHHPWRGHSIRRAWSGKWVVKSIL